MNENTEQREILPEELKKLIIAVKAVVETKAVHPVLFDITDRQTFTDYVLICHGTSDRHVQSIMDEVQLNLKKHGILPIGFEGEELHHWALLDFGGLVVHIFYEPLRDFYDLEGIWEDCPRIDPTLFENMDPDAEQTSVCF